MSRLILVQLAGRLQELHVAKLKTVRLIAIAVRSVKLMMHAAFTCSQRMNCQPIVWSAIRWTVRLPALLSRCQQHSWMLSSYASGCVDTEAHDAASRGLQ